MGKTLTNCSKAVALSCALLVAGMSMSFMPIDGTIQAEAVETYNYAKGLQYSMYLYDANMCGDDVDENSAMDWRGDCHTDDANATYNGKTVDVSGGYHDAGDHVKFGLPQAYSASVLGYGYYEFKDAYTQTGQADHMKTISTYFADYFKNCTVMENGKVTAFCYQVGDGTTDHAEWCSPESQDIDRPTYWATSSNPATDIVANTAGALALHYKNFGDTESLTYAKALYEFAKTNNKACATDGVSGFYDSDTYIDDLMWSAAALYIATGDTSYVSDANQFLSDYGNSYAFCSTWALCWGNMWPLVNLTFGQLSSGITSQYGNVTSQMMEQVQKTMDEFMSNYNTSEGYASFQSWGSARYNTAMQLVGLVYDKINGTSKYTSWAKSQMDYLLGDNSNNLCYITGYSSNSVTQPHHRAATGYDGFPSENVGVPYANTLIGALVGGPDSSGNFVDDVEQYTYTEVAIDYNAGLVGAMAGLYLQYGSGQSVDSSIVGVSGVKTGSTSTTTTTTTTTTTEATTTTTSASSVTSSPSNTTTTQGVITTTAPVQSETITATSQLENNNDGTNVLKIAFNTGDSDTISLTLTGGVAGATTSGMIGYWDNSASQWVEPDGSSWEGKTFDSNGNLTITGLKVPTNTDNVQILLTYYADWSTGSENNLDKTSLSYSISDGSATTNATVTTVPTTTTTAYSYNTVATTTTAQSNSNNTINATTQLENNSDGTNVLKIAFNTGNSDTVSLTLTGGVAGATTSGLVGYWDNNSQSWVENSPWSEQKFDSNGNLTITGLKVPTNTDNVQILLTYYADWSSGSENNLDKTSLGYSVSDGSSSANTTVTTAYTYNTSNTSATTTTTPSQGTATGSTGNKLSATTQLENNSDGTDVLKISFNTGNSNTVSLTLTGGVAGATTSGLVGYWDSSANKWVEASPWSEQKFDSNGNLTITGLSVPTNTDNVQILLTYYADWASGSENNLDKTSLGYSVSDGSSTASTTVTTVTTVTNAPTSTTTKTTTTTSGSTSTGNSTTKGDADCDGSVNAVDLLSVKKHLLGMTTLTGQGFNNCDLDGDGEITAAELVLIKKFVLMMIDSL